MPRRDWISHYPRIASLLQQDGDALLDTGRRRWQTLGRLFEVGSHYFNPF